MFLRTPPCMLSTIAALSALLFIGGCGGGNAHEHGTGEVRPTTPSGLPAPLPLPADGAPDPGQIAPAPPATIESITLSASTTPLMSATRDALPAWPAWQGTGQAVDGVHCLASAKIHQHALISVYQDGKRLGLPDGIGSVNALCQGAYELHVHDVTGIIHMESDVPKSFKLGQWFSLWQQPLGRDSVAGLAGPVRYYIIENGTITRYDGNPYDIALLPYREVLIVTGSQMSVAPRYEWPPGV